MYFNPDQRERSFSTAVKQQQTNSGVGESGATVLTSLNQPVTKRFFINAEGKLNVESYGNAFLFKARVHPVSSIHDLAELVAEASKGTKHILIRGLPWFSHTFPVQRTKENFEEHPEGTPWVMLDFDNIAVPEDINPLSEQGLEWVIQKLPPEFRSANYFYQFSGSAGVLNEQGQLRKKGLNAHVFFWLSQRYRGDLLAPYLCKHCQDTAFYWVGPDAGGNCQIRYGIDPAPIRSEVQPHSFLTDSWSGVQSLLRTGKRQGLVKKSADAVSVPTIGHDVLLSSSQRHRQIREVWQRANGFKTMSTLTGIGGSVAVTRYASNPSNPLHIGRVFLGGRLSGENDDFLVMRFEEENTPASW